MTLPPPFFLKVLNLQGDEVACFHTDLKVCGSEGVRRGGLRLLKRRRGTALQIWPDAKRDWVGAGLMRNATEGNGWGVGGLAQSGVGGWVAILRRGGWGGKFPSVGLHKSFIYRLLL
jgi:CubicO group peptidase (beta-lactamase class C family)